MKSQVTLHFKPLHFAFTLHFNREQRGITGNNREIKVLLCISKKPIKKPYEQLFIRLCVHSGGKGIEPLPKVLETPSKPFQL